MVSFRFMRKKNAFINHRIEMNIVPRISFPDTAENRQHAGLSDAFEKATQHIGLMVEEI